MSKKAKHFNINGESIDVAVDWENVEGAPDIPSAASEISTDEGISDGKNVQADLTSLAQKTTEIETTANSAKTSADSAKTYCQEVKTALDSASTEDVNAANIAVLNNKIGDVSVSGTWTNGSWQVIADNIDIKSGDVFSLKISSDVDWSRIVVSYNGSNYSRVIDKTSSGNSIDTELTAPVDITKLSLFLTLTESATVDIVLQYGLTKQANDASDNIANLDVRIPIDITGTSFPNKGFVRYSDGYLNTTDGSHNYFEKEVQKDDVVYYALYAGTSVAIIAAFDSDGNFLQDNSIVGSGKIVSGKYIVEDGVDMLRVCINNTYKESCQYQFVRYAKESEGVLKDKDVADAFDDIELLPTIGIVNTISRNIPRLFPQTKLPVISFEFDDCNTPGDTKVVELFDSKNAVCSFAFIANESNINDRSGIYLAWQSKGYSILNHSIDGNAYTTTNYTYDTALIAMMTAKNRLQSKGFVINGFVAPSSSMDESFLPALKAIHAYAYTTPSSKTTDNPRTSNSCEMHRYSLESNTTEAIKAYIDDCIINDQMITFYGHSANFDVVNSTCNETWDIAKLTEVLDYVISKRDGGLVYLGNSDECAKYFFDLH